MRVQRREVGVVLDDDAQAVAVVALARRGIAGPDHPARRRGVNRRVQRRRDVDAGVERLEDGAPAPVCRDDALDGILVRVDGVEGARGQQRVLCRLLAPCRADTQRQAAIAQHCEGDRYTVPRWHCFWGQRQGVAGRLGPWIGGVHRP